MDQLELSPFDQALTKTCGNCGHRHLLGEPACLYPIPAGALIFDCPCQHYEALSGSPSGGPFRRV